MSQKELFAELLSIVSKETEISEDKILSTDKTAEVVDARYILAYLLHGSGIYPSKIADYIGKSKRCVNIVISNFNARLEGGKIMRINYENIKKLLGNK